MKTPDSPGILTTGVSREKYWKELDQEQKIERARTVVRQMERRLERLISLCENLSNKFDAHQHSEQGNILFRDRLGNAPETELRRHISDKEGDEVFF